MKIHQREPHEAARATGELHDLSVTKGRRRDALKYLHQLGGRNQHKRTAVLRAINQLSSSFGQGQGMR